MTSDNFSSEMKSMIEKFDGKKNFSLWQVRMKDVLIQQGIDEALNGEDDKPVGMTDKTWEKMNSKAASTIRLSLTDDVVYDVIDETSAKDLWKKLEDLYMGKNFTNRLLLKQELYSLRRKEGVDLQSHICQFNKLLCDLSNVGVKLDDEDKAIILLTSVKSTHNHLFNTLLYGRDTITVEQVKKALLSSEKMEKDDDSKKYESQALVIEDRRRNNYGKNYQGGGGASREIKNGDRKEFKPYIERECYYCGEKGHFIANCSLRKKKQEEIIGVVEDNNSIDEALSITEKKVETGWLLDSACCYHICSNKQLFSSYKSMEGEIFMGNNSSDVVVGIGTVKIKTSNGLIRTLTNVRYVPTLRRNLISLGYLESKGFSFGAINGLMKVKKESRIMLMAKRIGTMYFLLGDAFVDGGAIKLEKKRMEATTPISSNNFNQGGDEST